MLVYYTTLIASHCVCLYMHMVLHSDDLPICQLSNMPTLFEDFFPLKHCTEHYRSTMLTYSAHAHTRLIVGLHFPDVTQDIWPRCHLKQTNLKLDSDKSDFFFLLWHLCSVLLGRLSAHDSHYDKGRILVYYKDIWLTFWVDIINLLKLDCVVSRLSGLST